MDSTCLRIRFTYDILVFYWAGPLCKDHKPLHQSYSGICSVYNCTCFFQHLLDFYPQSTRHPGSCFLGSVSLVSHGILKASFTSTFRRSLGDFYFISTTFTWFFCSIAGLTDSHTTSIHAILLTINNVYTIYVYLHANFCFLSLMGLCLMLRCMPGICCKTLKLS